jgi:hypothetical protein
VLKTLVGSAAIVTWYVGETISENVVVGPIRKFRRGSDPSIAFIKITELRIVNVVLDESPVWSTERSA